MLTAARGERNGRAKLTRAQVDEIRAMCADGRWSKAFIGRAFGVSSTHVLRISRGELSGRRPDFEVLP
jgi:hypothetical protein